MYTLPYVLLMCVYCILLHVFFLQWSAWRWSHLESSFWIQRVLLSSKYSYDMFCWSSLAPLCCYIWVWCRECIQDCLFKDIPYNYWKIIQFNFAVTVIGRSTGVERSYIERRIFLPRVAQKNFWPIYFSPTKNSSHSISLHWRTCTNIMHLYCYCLTQHNNLLTSWLKKNKK